MKNDGNLKKLAVDIDKLGIDWDAQRVRINERVSKGEAPIRKLSWALGVFSVAAMIVIAVIIFTFSAPRIENGNDLYTEVDIEDEIPYGLYVLNGFTEETTSFDETVQFILAEEGDTL